MAMRATATARWIAAVAAVTALTAATATLVRVARSADPPRAAPASPAAAAIGLPHRASTPRVGQLFEGTASPPARLTATTRVPYFLIAATEHACFDDDLPLRIVPDHVRCTWLRLRDHNAALVVVETPVGVQFGVDLNRTGVITDDEWFDAPLVDGEHKAVIETSVRSDEGVIESQVLLRMQPGDRRIGISEPSRRARVQLPSGPVDIELVPHGGWYGGPGTRVQIDIDNDGFVTRASGMETVRRGSIIKLGGTPYRVSTNAHGDLVSFEVVEPQPGLLAVGEPAPDFDVRALDGSQHSLAAYRGRWLLIDFWGTWSGPSREDLARVRGFAETNPETAILGMASDPPYRVRNYVTSNPHPWPDAAIDGEGPIARAYGVQNWPTYALIDPDGDLVELGSLFVVSRARARRRLRASARAASAP